MNKISASPRKLWKEGRRRKIADLWKKEEKNEKKKGKL